MISSESNSHKPMLSRIRSKYTESETSAKCKPASNKSYVTISVHIVTG